VRSRQRLFEAIQQSLFTFFGQCHSLVADSLFNFPRTLRLIRPEEYAVGLKSRILVRGARFALHLRRNGFDRWRLGLVVPKRYAPRAIERNTIKRIWREAFRLRWHALQEIDSGESGESRMACDLVVRLLPQKPPVQTGKKKRKVPVKPLPLDFLRRDGRFEAASLLDQLQQRLNKIDSNVPTKPAVIQAETADPMLVFSEEVENSDPAKGMPKETPCVAP